MLEILLYWCLQPKATYVGVQNCDGAPILGGWCLLHIKQSYCKYKMLAWYSFIEQDVLHLVFCAFLIHPNNIFENVISTITCWYDPPRFQLSIPKMIQIEEK